LRAHAASGRAGAWEDAGRQVASMLVSYSSAVITSSDPNAAANVALGIARAEASHRRVVVGDLVGDLPPLRHLAGDADPHGISDSFLYGVSLNKIGRETEETTNLFIMTSGTEPVMVEEIIGNERWKRLAAGFEEVGALLLLVTRTNAPGLAQLIEHLDGVVLVKESDLPEAPHGLVLARVPSPTRTLQMPAHSDAVPARTFPRWGYVALIAALLVAGAAIARIRSTRADSSVSAVANVAPLPVVAPAPEALSVGIPQNAGDSALASAFAVELVAANTLEGANFELQRHGARLPSATVAPVPIGPDRTTWYKVIAGAYTERSGADSLLRALRRGKILGDSSGSVLRTPLALLVDSVAARGGMAVAARAAVRKYADRGFAAYSLVQVDGGARIYAGAFDKPEQAAELLRVLREAGLNPALVYRTGRTP